MVQNVVKLINKPRDRPMRQQDLAKKVGCSPVWLSRVLGMQAVGSDELYEKLHMETKIPRTVLFNGPAKKIKKHVALYLRQARIKEMGQRR